MNDTRTEPTLHAASTPLAYEGPRSEFGTQRDQGSEPRERRNRRRMRWLIALLLLCAAAALVSMLWQPRGVAPVAVPLPNTEPPAPAPTAQPRYPIESAVAVLPPLDGSDAMILAALQTMMGGGGLASMLETRDLIRNFVVTVDNLPRRALPPQKLPTRPVRGSFGTAASGNALVIGESNALRYAPYVKLLQSADLASMVTLYARNYPLFQQAYRELGFPDGHFNDRLVEAIDVLLASPEPATPPKVVQPKIFYEFADRELEQLPAGKKLMLRMGSDNAAAVKKRLRELRALVTAQAPEQAREARPERAAQN
jgi:hypothetical protein